MIYLITCSRWSLQYVGETVQKLNKKFNFHRTGFNQPGKYSFCHIPSDHFHKDACCSSSCLVQILKKLKGNGGTARMLWILHEKRKQREKSWIMQLKPICPFGLNDCLGDEYKKEDTHMLKGNKFPPLP